MALALNASHHVSTITDDSQWAIVIERERRYIRLVAVSPSGEPRGFVRLHTKNARALAAALLEAADESP